MRSGCTVHTSSALDIILFFCGDVYIIWVYVCDENNGKAVRQPMSSETENSSVAGWGILRKPQLMANDDGQIIPYLISTSIVDSFC